MQNHVITFGSADVNDLRAYLLNEDLRRVSDGALSIEGLLDYEQSAVIAHWFKDRSNRKTAQKEGMQRYIVLCRKSGNRIFDTAEGKYMPRSAEAQFRRNRAGSYTKAHLSFGFVNYWTTEKGLVRCSLAGPDNQATASAVMSSMQPHIAHYLAKGSSPLSRLTVSYGGPDRLDKTFHTRLVPKNYN